MMVLVTWPLSIGIGGILPTIPMGQIKNFNRRQYVYDNAGNITEFRLENSTDGGVTYQESIKELFTYDFDHKDPWNSLLTRQLGS